MPWAPFSFVYMAARIFSTEKRRGSFCFAVGPAVRTIRPEHPRSPASRGLLSQMPMRKAPPARTGLEGLIALHHFPFTAAISASVKRFTES